MTIALITARGGSTRTPRKNMADVCGHPLVAWQIIAAKTSVLVDEVYLTTDDDEIAEAGEKYGANIIRRPVWDNGITAGVPYLHAVQTLARQGILPDIIHTMLPTSPLIKPGDIDRMIRAHKATLLPVTMACPQKETWIFKNIVPFQDRFLTMEDNGYFRAKQVLGDKFWNYSKLAGGASTASREYLVGVWDKQADFDIEIDTKPVNTETIWTFVPVEEWQTFEVDYPSDLELVRVLFKHYIGGVEPYLDYAKEHENER